MKSLYEFAQFEQDNTLLNLVSSLGTLRRLLEETGSDIYEDYLNAYDDIIHRIFDISLLPWVRQKEYIDMLEPFKEETQQFFHKATFAYEMYLSNKIVSFSDVKEYQTIFSFYYNLVENEIEHITNNINLLKSKRVVFIGSGPIPFTAILLYMIIPSIRIDLVDISQNALYSAHKIIKRFKLDDSIKILEAISIEDFQQWHKYDIIFVAGMIGETPDEKIQIYSNMCKKLNNNQVVVTRTVRQDSIASFIDIPLPLQEIPSKYMTSVQDFSELSFLSSVLLRKR